MKSIKIFALSLVVLGFSATTFGQSLSDAASASATLLVPISIAKTTDMNFGTFASSGTEGTITLDYANATTVTGGLTKFGGTISTATFTVTGDSNKAFSISHPESIVLTGSVSGSLTVNLVNELGTTGTLVSGTKVIKMGGSITVPANQVAGVYSNTADLKVTVNYN